MDNSKIEWTDATWNPVRGCEIVSSGCKNCYAMQTAHRFSGPGMAYEGLTRQTRRGPVWNGKIKLVPELLDQPLRWQRPRRIFVNSMSDLFHDDVPDSFIDDVFAVMALSPRHTFQVLTKRPERMRRYMKALDLYNRILRAADKFRAKRPRLNNVPISDPALNGGAHMPQVWLGVSAEDSKTYKERVLYLADTPAAVRFVSFEPLLSDVGNLMLDGVFEGAFHWAIVGGESTPKARPVHPDWVRSIRDQCNAANVKFFFKQWGEWGPYKYGGQGHEDFNFCEVGKPFQWMCRVGKKTAGRMLDGRAWDEYPERGQ